MSNFIEEFKFNDGKDKILRIYQDGNSESPREKWDNVGTMICFHRNYTLGDIKESEKYNNPENFLDTLSGISPKDMNWIKDGKDWYVVRGNKKIYENEFCQYQLDLIFKNNVILPLRLYDHSGISMSTSKNYPYNDYWDSMQVGWIFMSYEEAKENWGWKKITKKRIEQIKDFLEEDVETYDQYLTGDIYGFELFEIEKVTVTFPSGTQSQEERENEIDSCWGFYGSDHYESGLLDHAGISKEQFDNFK